MPGPWSATASHSQPSGPAGRDRHACCRRARAGPRWTAGCRPPGAARRGRRSACRPSLSVVAQEDRRAAIRAELLARLARDRGQVDVGVGQRLRRPGARWPAGPRPAATSAWWPGRSTATARSRSAGVASGAVSEASRLARMIASGLRSSCEASSISWRCAWNASSSRSSIESMVSAEVAQLVVRAVQADPPGQVGRLDLPGGAGDRADRAQRPAGQHPADAEAGHEQPAERDQRVVAQRLQRAEVDRRLDLARPRPPSIVPTVLRPSLR